MSDQPKPPYVEFEVRPVEDRSASEAQGHVAYRDEIYAIVTPAGTRDRLEKVAEEWIKGLEEGVQQERIPAEWLDGYRRRLEAFKNGQEAPVDGTAIQHMTTLTPAQVKNCLNANVRTVEDLSTATEEAMTRIGMGGRELKAKAKAWLDAASKTGKSAEELNNLRVENQTQAAKLEEQGKTITDLTSRLAALEALNAKD